MGRYKLRKNFYIASIIFWLGGNTLLIVIDYLIRHASNNFHRLGMNETLWFLLQIIIGIGSLGLLIKAVKHMSTHKAVLLSGVTIVVGFVVYVGLMWFYIVGTGVDSV